MHSYLWLGLSSIFLVSGCTISMSDDAIFHPPEWKSTAQSADELYMLREDELTTTANKENRIFKPEVLPAKITHGFWDTESNRIAYTLIEANDNVDTSDRPWIVSCYGTGGDRPNHGVYYAEKQLSWGDVLQFDYPGYGDSSGKPSVDAIEAIKQDVVSFANELAGDRPLVFWGHSLGGFVCPHFAEISPKLDGFVFESTALNAEEAAEVWKPWFLRFIPFVKLEPSENDRESNNAAPLREREIPVLVLSGGKDNVLPSWLSVSLANALKEQGSDVTYLEFEKANHMTVPFQMDFPKRTEEFWAKVSDHARGKGQNLQVKEGDIPN